MKSCNDCEFYHDEYGGVCFAQKDAPRVESLTIAKTCSDFTYKDAKVLLDPISLSKEQVRDIYEFHENLRKKMEKRREEFNKILKDANDEFHNLYLESQREKEE